MRYIVVGTQREGFAVVEACGGIVYDLIFTREEAKEVCAVLNRECELCPYCGVRPVDAAGRSCTECDDMLCNCDPGDEDNQ